MKYETLLFFYELLYFPKRYEIYCYSFACCTIRVGNPILRLFQLESNLGAIETFDIAVFFFLLILKHPKISRWASGFGHVVKMLCIVSILNVLPSYVFWGVPFSQGVNIYVPLAFLTFYIYRAYNFTERDVLRMLIGIAVVVAIIQIVQQLSPSNAVFGIYSDQETDWGDGNIVEVRNGLNRYRIGTTSLTSLCLFYYWAKIMVKRSKGTLLMFGLMLVSVYLYLTRQLLFFSALTLALSFLMINDTKKRLLYLGLISLGSILLYNFSTVLFGELLESTVEESTKDNIRLIATAFFGTRVQVLLCSSCLVMGIRMK